MLTLLTYKTPPRFANDFIEFYSSGNIRQVKALSLILLVTTMLIRIVSLISYEQPLTIASYNELAILNLVEIVGFIVFFIISIFGLKTQNLNSKHKASLTIAFIVFILLVSLSTSYIISAYDTKNKFTIYLMGVFAVSLFFVVEYKTIISIAFFIALVFMLSMITPKIEFQDKLFNSVVGLIIAIFLVGLSRYNYCHKSQQFVKVRELEEKNAEIERLNNQKNEILAFVVHDLRNPLTNIQMLSSFLLEENAEQPEAIMIASAAKQANAIINDLMDGVKNDRLLLKTEKIEIAGFLLKIIHRWRTNSKRIIKFNSNKPEVFASINESKLGRVNDNLISNSLKFSASDRPVEIELAELGDILTITITDFGIGIPMHLQSLVFNQYSTAGRNGLHGEESTGLGLHISKKIVEQHSGNLLMQSKENEGTVFTILLPTG